MWFLSNSKEDPGYVCRLRSGDQQHQARSGIGIGIGDRVVCGRVEVDGDCGSGEKRIANGARDAAGDPLLTTCHVMLSPYNMSLGGRYCAMAMLVEDKKPNGGAHCTIHVL